MDGPTDVPRESWLRDRVPDVSRTVPWGVHPIEHEDVDFWQGCLDSDPVNEAVAALVEERH